MPIASVDSARSRALTNPELNGKEFKSKKTDFKQNYSQAMFRNTMDGFKISSNSVPSSPQSVNELKPVTLGQKILAISAVLQTINFPNIAVSAINSSASAVSTVGASSETANIFMSPVEKGMAKLSRLRHQRYKRDHKLKTGPQRESYNKMRRCVSGGQRIVAGFVSKLPDKSSEHQLCSTVYDTNRILNADLDLHLTLSSDTTCLWECHITSGQVKNNLITLSRARIELQQAEIASGDDQQKKTIHQYLETLDQAINNAKQVTDRCENLKKTEKEFIADYDQQQYKFELNCAPLFNIEWPDLPGMPNNPGYYGAQEILDLTRELVGKLEVRASEAYNRLPSVELVPVPGRIPILMARATPQQD